MRQMIVITNKN